MPRLPTTEDRVAPQDLSAVPERSAVPDPAEYDALLGIYTLYALVPRAEVVYFRLVVESWEDMAVVRTMQRFSEQDRGRSVVVVMAVPDYIGPCLGGLARLCAEVDAARIPVTPLLREALRRDLLDADDAGNPGG